jgi:hypothetical protein
MAVQNPRPIPVGDLLLDMQNPRVEHSKKQREEMQRLLDDQGDAIPVLAADIVENGISPIDLLLVMPSRTENDKFIALEGNRRLLALKILSNPHMLGDLTLPDGRRKRLEKLAAEFKDEPIKSVMCYEVESRAEAKHWLQLRHMGESDGAGVVGWRGVATARFRGEDPALQVIEFLLQSGQLTKEEMALVGSMKFPITTLRRLLETRPVKDFLGVEVKDEKLISGLPADELIKPLKRIALDLARGDITVTDVKLRDQQVAYVNKFPVADRPNLKKVGAMRPVQNIGPGDFGKKANGAKSQKKKKNTDPDRPTVVPKAHRCPIGDDDSKINEIYHELRRLRVEDTPHACAVLLRVFLELTTDRYCEHAGILLKVDRNGHKVDKNLAKKVEEACDHLVTAGSKKGDFYSLRNSIGQERSPVSATLLNAYVHNRFTKPSPRELRNAWDHAAPFIDKVWEILDT